MSNYFSDNADLQFQFENLKLAQVVKFLNHGDEDSVDSSTDEFYSEMMSGYQESLLLCGDISANFIAPRSAEIDRKGATFKAGKVSYSKEMSEVLSCLADAGFMGVIIPEEFGGLNFPATIYTMMIEMVSQADASVMTLFGYQDVGETIATLAQKDIANQFLPAYCRGEKIGAMVLTEPGGGSDLQAVKLAASQDTSGQWRLNGVKCFISHGHRDVLLVLARSDVKSPGMFGLSLFAVHGGSDNGVNVTRVEDKMGLHGSPTCELLFDNANASLVGKEGFGLFYVVDVLNQARFSVAAQAVGIAEAAYQAASDYADVRSAFGRPLSKIPLIHSKLLDMQALQAANRALIYAGCQWLDTRNTLNHHINNEKVKGNALRKEDRVLLKQAQKILNLLSPLVKLTATESAVKICYQAQQVFGGSGYIKGAKVEQCMRDVRITTIYEGTSEVLAGLVQKYILIDVLSEYFKGLLTNSYDARYKTILVAIVELRSLFVSVLESLPRDNEYYMAAVSKELATMYGALYASCLLLESSLFEPARISLATRYSDIALAEGYSCSSRLKSGLYRIEL